MMVTFKIFKVSDALANAVGNVAYLRATCFCVTILAASVCKDAVSQCSNALRLPAKNSGIFWNTSMDLLSSAVKDSRGVTNQVEKQYAKCYAFRDLARFGR